MPSSAGLAEREGSFVQPDLSRAACLFLKVAGPLGQPKLPFVTSQDFPHEFIVFL